VRLFITGTDTEVGKSMVTACLAASARATVGPGGVVAAKPVASGVEPGRAGDDAELIAAAAGHAPRVFATYQAPVSPHRAARLEGRPVDDAALLAWLGDLQAPNVLVEGVGGWRVPVTETLHVVDLARAVAAPVLVVAADRLGVLNHTLLTVEAVRRDGLAVAGVVLNRGAGANAEDASLPHNLDDLRELLDVPVAALDPLPDGPAAYPGGDLARALGMLWSGASGE